MKIKIGNFSLSEIGELSPDSLRVNGKRLTQISAALRAASSQIWNRQNTVTTITFSITREHADVRAAEEYLIQHEADIPSSGICEFICHDESGGESSFYLDTGCLETTEAYNIGCSTIHSYTLIGGRITSTKPS